MSSVKKALKLAKSAIDSGDAELAHEHIQDALRTDPESYFAYVFLGKAYQLENDIANANKAFERATQLEPENMLAWRGYLQSVKSESDYALFFKVVTQLIRLQVDQGFSIAETIKDIRNYLAVQKYKKNPVLHEMYLRQLKPGAELAELVGSALGNPVDNLRDLIKLTAKKLEVEVTHKSAKERVKYGRRLTANQQLKMDNFQWAIYKNTDLESLYEMYLNIGTNDDQRRIFEDDLLNFRYQLLKVCPEKKELLHKIQEMVDGMALVRTSSRVCWNLYFEWLDIQNIADLHERNVIYYLNHFPGDGLGIVLYAYALSDISPFNKNVIINSVKSHDSFTSTKEQKTSKRKKRYEAATEVESNTKPGKDRDPYDISQFYLSSEEVISFMLKGYDCSKQSVLAIRIIIEFYIRSRNFPEATKKCKEGIRLLADLQRSFGINLKNSREHILSSLADIYTQQDTPKNFNKALELYNKILDFSPDSVNARVGKGLILIENGKYAESKMLLEGVVQKHQDNVVAQVEYYWCSILLNDHESGRKGLYSALEKINGVDNLSKERRSVIRWRIAQSYYVEDSSNAHNLSNAYSVLIEALKDSRSYAPIYTLLGILFKDYYSDSARAQRCFYKAFELDYGETTAAKYIVEELSSKDEWGLAQTICERIVNSEDAMESISKSAKDNKDRSWPYRVLGYCGLNRQSDYGTVEWLQNALRIDSTDYECWTALGEAYLNCGRLEAAVKVLQFSLSLNEGAWETKYLLGIAHCSIFEFDEGIKHLVEALEYNPGQECILNAIYESYLENTHYLLFNGFSRRAISSNFETIKYLQLSVMQNKDSQSLWKALAECFQFYLTVREKIGSFPIDFMESLFGTVNFDTPTNDVLAKLEDKESSNLSYNVSLFNSGKREEAICNFMIMSSKAAVQFLTNKPNRSVSAAAYYNLGLSYSEAFQLTDIAAYRDNAIIVLKKAIQLEDTNASFWTALGSVYVTSNVRISQHCFIMACEIDGRDVIVWTNLAALYLYVGDYELANECFLRAQAAEPLETNPLLGQALAADAMGDESLAAKIFSHAFSTSRGRSPLALVLYGLSVLQRRIDDIDPTDYAASLEFSLANEALLTYLKYAPDDVFALEAAATIAERCKSYDVAVTVGERLCTILEAKYEETEDEQTLVKYASSKSQLARLYLGMLEYQKALDCAENAIELIGDSTEDAELSKIELSSRIVLGLSWFFNDEFELALKELRSILSDHGNTRSIAILVAQILYAYGSEETKSAALDQLFSYIEENGSSLAVVLTLGAMCVGDNIEEYLLPVKEELVGISLEDVIRDTHRDIPRLISEINKRIDGVSGNNDYLWQRNAVLFPSEYEVWKKLNSTMAVSVAALEKSKVSASQASEAHLLGGSLRELQRSMILAPNSAIASQAFQKMFA
ncbi:antiviral protein [Scheffersomyces stipitis CBS 6054]|uniref:Antiviral protein n=1 Tax=Scheffersomyces stipitis (strain ATCC 58785 / CBS 6054 / NBRC 10063 / NRRL Y-11545) TaxID=322104 RepID=A3LQY0_PICST|nr:antiviral protein [Scheffersomyces stipitis CBS 6054]ABN65293.2 antiviral protein [Scheffersomyces stipitis CBS 6054]KAG2733921.1 hypothetical protein G9P44_003446 [Scheffersomyces stipitis]